MGAYIEMLIGFFISFVTCMVTVSLEYLDPTICIYSRPSIFQICWSWVFEKW